MMEGMETESHYVVRERVIEDYILVHLDNCSDKFNLLIFMLHKLFTLVDETVAQDNLDTLQNHEVLLPGHLLTIYLKEISFKVLQELAKPHIDSFNYFVGQGLEAVVSNIRSVVIQQPRTLSKLRMTNLDLANI